jgi:hypothetical protein
VDELTKNKCNLYIQKDNLNTLDDDGNENKMTKIVLTVLSQFGEIEGAAMKYRTKNGKKTSALNGNYVGGVQYYGYSYIDKGKRDKKLIVVESEKEIVLRIFRDFVIHNKPLLKIAMELNINTIPTKTKILNMKNTEGIKWSTTQVRDILLAKMYIGTAQYREKIGTKKVNRKEKGTGKIIEKEEPIYETTEIILPKELIFNELFEVWEGDTIWNIAQQKLKTNKNIAFVGLRHIFISY